MQVFFKKDSLGVICLLKELPYKIEYNAGNPTISIYLDGSTANVGCIGCKNPKCMYFSQEEIKTNNLSNFPNDKDNNVCPVQAITLSKDKQRPVINNEKCIKCGVCMRRCPIGAIYFDDAIKVNYSLSDRQYLVEESNETLKVQQEQILLMVDIKKQGLLLKESDELFEEIYDKLQHINHNYHNLIARNLLISLGSNCAIRRIGDVYTRMDAIYNSADGSFGAVEVEFGKETLDASRAILDDIAVLYTRYEINKDDNTPVVICLQLPNARQGYWQVVKDVKNVEDIKIQTLSIGALMLLNWNGCLFIPDDSTYYLDYDNMDLRSIISWQLDRKINITKKYLGILEPNK